MYRLNAALVVGSGKYTEISIFETLIVDGACSDLFEGIYTGLLLKTSLEEKRPRGFVIRSDGALLEKGSKS